MTHGRGAIFHYFVTNVNNNNKNLTRFISAKNCMNGVFLVVETKLLFSSSDFYIINYFNVEQGKYL